MRQSVAPVFDPSIAAFLDDIYRSCTLGSRLKRDPLAIVVRYPEIQDREIAAFVCSTLAFGSVDLILRACEAALAPLGKSPAAALASLKKSDFEKLWGAFQYRFCFSSDLVFLLKALAAAKKEFGGLEELFVSGDPGGETVVEGLSAFVRNLRRLGPGDSPTLRENLLPDPIRGSACKRLLLCLRWLVRKDAVDPGGWSRLAPSRLVVPLDTHMTRVCHENLKFLAMPRADLKAALAATKAFRLYAPEDPVKYDFALTRPGIDPEAGDERFACP